MLYYERMRALIEGWRKLWCQGEFPFYYVQLPPYRYRDVDLAASRSSRYAVDLTQVERSEQLPELWESQTATLGLANTGMAVTVDIGEVDNIHPYNKKDVGHRLALWALAKVYGKEGIVYSGPLYKSMKIEGDKVRVYFDHVGGGLVSRDGEALSWFELAGADKQYVKAQAVIDGDTVVVFSNKIDQPMAVRLGWDQIAEPNLSNREGLPAAPFRTEN